MVDRDPERRADLVLTAIAAADRAGLVVVDREVPAQLVVNASRALRLSVFPQEGEHGGLVRRETRVKSQRGARLALDLVLVVGVDQEREQRAIDARGRLDDEGEVALASLLVEVRQVLAARLRVLAKVEVAAVRDALELGPAERERI